MLVIIIFIIKGIFVYVLFNLEEVKLFGFKGLLYLVYMCPALPDSYLNSFE